MACLDEIVTLGLCPDDGTPSSGLKLVDAPGITLKNLALTATETYTSGVDMALAKKDLALILVRNDFISELHRANVITEIAQPVYDAGIFNPDANNGTYSGYRGLTLYKTGYSSTGLKSMFIEEVQLYPLASGEATLKIVDGYKEYTYPITLVANQVNVFGASELSGFPFTVESSSARVTIDNTSISFAKTALICHSGCSGSKNSCGYVDGWDGTNKVQKEGYGINIKFKCECDYSKILCSLSNSFAGELIWLKWQILIMEEQFNSNRFEGWVIYGRDELKDYIIPQLYSKYNAKWAALTDGLSGILGKYRDDCLNCKKARWVSSL